MQSFCYGAQMWLLAAQKPVLERQVLAGKVALFRRPATWGEGGLMSKSQLQRFCSTMEVFKGRIIWGGGWSLHYLPLCAGFLLIGWWWGNRNLVLSLKLPSSTWVGALVPAKELKVLLCIFLEKEPGPCPVTALLFLDCFSLVSVFSPFPD